MKKILVIKLGPLAELVRSVGTFQAIQQHFVGAEFHIMTMARYIDMADQLGIFSDYIIDNRASKYKISESFRINRTILAGHYDMIIDLQCTPRTRLYRRLWTHLGPTGSRSWLDTRRGKLYTVKKSMFCLPGETSSRHYVISKRPSDLRALHGEAKNFNLLPEKFVLMVPGSTAQFAYKRWSVSNYRKLVELLADRGIKSVILGTKEEADVVEQIAKGHPTAINMVGKSELLDIPQIAQRALLTVGNDTGPTHISSLSHVYTVGLFDQRHAQEVLAGPDSKNIVSYSGVEEIKVEAVWAAMVPRLPEA